MPLSFGLLRPFRRDQKADFAASGAEQVIRSAVGQILGTVGSSDFTQGELPWRTEFGSLLHLLRHQKNDRVLQELARVYVVDALKRWEPRVVVTAVRAGKQRHPCRAPAARHRLTRIRTPGLASPERRRLGPYGLPQNSARPLRFEQRFPGS